MSLLNILSDDKFWVGFYEQKTDPDYCRISDAKDLFRFVREKRYKPVVDRIMKGQGLSVPVKKRIAKSDTSKKRIVYSLPQDETIVLKLLTWLLIREYDDYFSSSLYSFRPGYGSKDALRKLLHCPEISRCYSYKLDVRNYFNSIDVELLLPILKDLLSNDAPVYGFLAALLTDSRVMEDGVEIREKKGVMAGMPYAVFLANVYLTPLDRMFEQVPGVIYCRYSDDIVIFSEDKESLDNAKELLHEFLRNFRLEVNQDKVAETLPGEPWTFLGFECDGRNIDVSRVSVQKLKDRMRRKSRALRRWAEVNGKDGWMAARAFIKHFNKMLYTSESSSEINWSLWYFPLITTDRSLKEIDSYMQDCVRYVATGKRNKSRFDLRYDQMKDLGMQSLVNVWYSYRRA